MVTIMMSSVGLSVVVLKFRCIVQAKLELESLFFLSSPVTVGTAHIVTVTLKSRHTSNAINGVRLKFEDPLPSMSAAVTFVDIFSGVAAGINVTIVGHPFETIKVRLQTQPSPPNNVYTGFLDCIKKTLQWEGVRGLYKGVSAPLTGQLFFRSLMFWTNGAYIRWVSNGGQRQLTNLQYAVGGSVAWGVGAIVECPLQLASSQLQVQIVKLKSDPAYKPEYRGVFDYFRVAVPRHGLRALYHGLAPQLVRNIVGGFLHFGAFEALRREQARRKGVSVAEVGLATNLAAASVGGFLYWLITYPADVIKSALQGDALDPAARRYRGAVDAAGKLWAEGGAARFTRGLSACLLRSVPASAVLLTTAFRVKEVGYARIDAASARK
jgi:solute carrier family 25 (mitochondrial carnitine/acylcarnitine transporter), member 20/29